MTKLIQIFGGGTVNYIRSHLAISAPAYGSTARVIYDLCHERIPNMTPILQLTKMADPRSAIETSDDLAKHAKAVRDFSATKMIFFSAAVADFHGRINDVEGSKNAARLRSREGDQNLILTPADKIIQQFRAGPDGRKDLFLVGFKATFGATPAEQYAQGLNMLKASSANLVFANDGKTKVNMIICPEESVYSETTNRYTALRELVDMSVMRSHLTFTRSTVVAGSPVPWNDDLVPSSLRQVVDFCIKAGAYKKFRGVTAGHFAVKIDDTTFLTSRRKTDFNDMANVGLVLVKTSGPDSVVAYGSRPSVGGQSQRIVFTDHPEEDCVVHFHCDLLPGSQIPSVSQREFECGSHECGRNTSNGLKQFGNIKAVMLDNHGPNIVFNRNVDAQQVIKFITDNFDLTSKSGGYLLPVEA